MIEMKVGLKEKELVMRMIEEIHFDSFFYTTSTVRRGKLSK